jgi:hypothetical protein
MALSLPARVPDNLALEQVDESSADLAPRSRAKIGMVEIRISPSKPGIGEMKLSRTYIRRSRK